MVWADYGYSANIRIGDFAADSTLLATAVAGEPLTPEHGCPMRLVVPHLYGWKSVKWVRAVEYLTEDRRGFWEERGYHSSADPWREERFSYQETSKASVRRVVPHGRGTTHRADACASPRALRVATSAAWAALGPGSRR